MIDLNKLPRATVINYALKSSFPEKIITEVEALKGYSSSQVYRILVGNDFYVLRVMGLDQPIEDRQQQMHCLERASSIGLAPRVIYADAKEGVAIMEFIQHQVPQGHEWLLKLAKSLRRLHDSAEKFPKYLGPSCFLTELFESLRKDHIPEYLGRYFENIEAIVKSLNETKELKSCHNDLNGGNILWDGNKVVFIDFEAASLEDPYFDLATVINQFIFEPLLEKKFLLSYFESSLDPVQNKKLLLMKQFSFCYYAAHFLSFARKNHIDYLSRGELEALPLIEDVRIAISNGVYPLDTPDDWMRYGMTMIKASLLQMDNPSFPLILHWYSPK
jgi:thiamine kinase-like enzyme